MAVQGAVDINGSIILSKSQCGEIRHIGDKVVDTSMYSRIPLKLIVTEQDTKETLADLFSEKPLAIRPSFHLYCLEHTKDAAVKYVLKALRNTINNDITTALDIIKHRTTALEGVVEFQNIDPDKLL